MIRESQSEGGKVEPKEKLFIRAQMTRTIDADPSVMGGELPPDIVSLSGRTSASKPLKICARIYISFTGTPYPILFFYVNNTSGVACLLE